MVVSPYGFWSSPITSDLVVADAIRLDQVALDGRAIYWTESQPQKQGRSFVYRVIEGKEPELVTPDDDNRFNVRTRVHEYGGGSFVVQHEIVYFSNFADQRFYRHDVGQQPRPITPPRTGALRYADGVVDRQRGRIICDTHKFESHYLDWLVGPYPQDHQAYVDRSPINHVDRLSVPVIFFQGVEDRIVPPNQTELLVACLKQRGIPFGYFLFDGEQHGFRRAENIKRCLDAELYFYVTLLLRSGLRF